MARWTNRMVYAVASASLGSAFQHGYNIGVTNAPSELLKEFINETYFERNGENAGRNRVTVVWSIIVSIFSLGGMTGAMGTAYIADRYGRKGGLLLNNILVFPSAALFGFAKVAKSYEMLIIGRFLVGVNCGFNAGLCPLYLSEISPVNLRGSVGTIYQLVIVIAILVSQILGMPEVLGTENLWPVLFAGILVPSLFMLFTMSLCPESPKYILINQGKDMEAQEALTWLRETEDVHDEIDTMRAESDAMKLVPKVNLRELFVNPTLRMPLTIAVVIMLSQQFSGINTVMYYSVEIFESAGLDEHAAHYGTLGIGVTNLTITIVSMVLVEKAGRKTLYLIGLLGMMVLLAVLTISMTLSDNHTWLRDLSTASVILYTTMFALGPGPIAWFLVPELFGQGSRSIAASIAGAVNWAANFLIGFLFPILWEVIQQYTFLIFSALLAYFCFYIYFWLPETRNKTVEEMAAYFRLKAYGCCDVASFNSRESL